MRTLWNIVLALFLVAGAAFAEEKVEHDRSRLSMFLQPSVSFLNFEQRKYFQGAIDTIYYSFLEDAQTNSDSLNVAKQDFQKVNFCFPVTAGLQFQIFEDQFISAGVGFIYDNESVVLTDRKGRTHNYSYTIQGTPLFLEYRLGIPKNFMSLSGESLFSISLRWYWVLPGTEIYSTWGKLDAKTPVTGSGFGIGIGYLIASWKNFNVYGDIGFSSISVESDKTFADIVPDGPEEKAKWNIGGLLMQVRVSFGLWNKPEPAEENEDDENIRPLTDSKPAENSDVKSAEEAPATERTETEQTETKQTESEQNATEQTAAEQTSTETPAEKNEAASNEAK